MVGFLGDFALFGAIALFLSAPVTVIGLQSGRRKTVRRFTFAAIVVGVVAASISLVSDWLVGLCREAGNTSCIDYGAAGMQLLLLLAYGIASFSRAYLISRN